MEYIKVPTTKGQVLEPIYTVEDFCQDNPQGTYILAIDGHVVCVQDGKFYDSWNSGKEIPIYYWSKEKK